MQNSIDHFFRGAFSVDIVVFTYRQGKLNILLQKKDEEPFKNEPGLIGKLMLPNEDTDIALQKLLDSTLGFSDFYTKQLQAFSDVARHPLGRVVTFAYYGLLPWERAKNVSTNKLSWKLLEDVPKLSYDHDKILKAVFKRFKKGLLRHPTVFELLSDEIILSDIIAIYEQAFGKKVDAPNFRKQLRKSKLLHPLGKFRDSTKHMGRPPELYSFDKAHYNQQKDKVQFNF